MSVVRIALYCSSVHVILYVFFVIIIQYLKNAEMDYPTFVRLSPAQMLVGCQKSAFVEHCMRTISNSDYVNNEGAPTEKLSKYILKRGKLS